MPFMVQIILIGAVVGFVARFLYPGPNTPKGFILTTLLRIIGSALATYVGRIIGLLETNKLAGPIGMVAGAVIVLFIWNRLVPLIPRL